MTTNQTEDLAYRFQYAPTNELAQVIDFGIDSPQHIDAARYAVLELLRRSSSVFQVVLHEDGFRTTVEHEGSVQDVTIQQTVDTLWTTSRDESADDMRVYDFQSALREQQQADAAEAYTAQFAVHTTAHYLNFLRHQQSTTRTPGVPQYLNMLSGLTIYGQMDGGQTEVAFYQQLQQYADKLTVQQSEPSTLSSFDTVHAFLLQHNMFHTYYAPIHEYLMRFAIKAPDTEYTVYRSWLHILMVSYLHDAVHESQQKYSDIPAPWLAVKVHEAMPTVDMVLDAVGHISPVLILSST